MRRVHGAMETLIVDVSRAWLLHERMEKAVVRNPRGLPRSVVAIHVAVDHSARHCEYGRNMAASIGL